ncbi:MAG: VanW family protein [Clostridiales bacterium]|nr:VanW family protein [Clostridiales bacterium]
MKIRPVLLLCLILLLPARIFAEGEGILYTGRVTKNMTIRATRSTSGKKLGGVAAGEFVRIREYGEKWTEIEADAGAEAGGSVTGYILSKNVEDLTAAAGYDDEGEALYAGVAGQELTLRAGKSRSAQRMQRIAEGEAVYVTSLEGEWLGAVKHGIRGYVLAEPVRDLKALRGGEEVPEEYRSPPAFEPHYTAEADLTLHIRKKADADAPSLGTVAEDERVEVMEAQDGWAYVRKGKAEGFVLAPHLKHYRKSDPYGPLIPGTRAYPSAAHLEEDTEIFDAETGERLRTLPAGAIVAIDEPETGGGATLPYHRVTAKIPKLTDCWLEEVVFWADAQPGELLAIYSTFFDPEPENETGRGRIFNIEEGVRRIGGAVIAPDEVFSFNALCAPYTKGNGYELGPIINYVSSQKTGYSGGICQVSTTLYNAALLIPIEIVRQQPHSSYGIFYAPLDLDAAVGAGNLDLKLRNALPYPIVIDSRTEGGVVTIRIYREGDRDV